MYHQHRGASDNWWDEEDCLIQSLHSPKKSKAPFLPAEHTSSVGLLHTMPDSPRLQRAQSNKTVLPHACKQCGRKALLSRTTGNCANCDLVAWKHGNTDTFIAGIPTRAANRRDDPMTWQQPEHPVKDTVSQHVAFSGYQPADGHALKSRRTHVAKEKGRQPVVVPAPPLRNLPVYRPHSTTSTRQPKNRPPATYISARSARISQELYHACFADSSHQ